MQLLGYSTAFLVIQKIVGSFLLIMPTQGLVSSPLCALLSGALALSYYYQSLECA